MKISVITVTYNAERFLASCIASLAAQKGVECEYIIVDGASRDNTLKIIEANRASISHFVSESDRGMYDALNKGIDLASGEIIAVLHADDMFASDTVLHDIVTIFESTGTDVVYGDLDYISPLDENKVIRRWKSASYKTGMFQFGWMPPHPTFYARKELFEKFGKYRLDLGSAADYELMIRFLHKYSVSSVYFPKILTKMRVGGISNSSISNRLKANWADMKAMKINGIKFPLLAAVLKPLRKIPQFWGF